MKTIDLPDLPELSGLNKAELADVFRLGLREIAKEQAVGIQSPASLCIAIDSGYLPALETLARHRGVTLPEFVSEILQAHCRSWRNYLTAAGVDVPA